MKALLNLLRSMRFAVAILLVVAVASAIGSILQQNQALAVYVSQYGELWTAIFMAAGLTDIYHAWWFFVLLAFMASSTALCLAQHTPAMLREMRSFRENRSLQSLRKAPFHAQISAPQQDDGGPLRTELVRYLRAASFRVKFREVGNGDFVVAARTGQLRRLGYLLVHGAMVLICIGGLIDGNVWLRLQMAAGIVHAQTREMPPEAVPAESRLGSSSGSFRAAMSVVEGQTQHAAFQSFGDAYLLQELPFSVKLRHFRVEHYDNGRPKDFASDIDIIDGGATHAVTLHVNHPYTYRGVTLYQSGFSDGGTELKMRLSRLDGGAPVTQVTGKIGDTSAILIDGQPLTMEFTEYRPINVFSNDNAAASGWLSQRQSQEKMRDVGPSLAFSLRDQQGQASDWQLFVKPVEIEKGRYYTVIGKRTSQENQMKYLRLPLDRDGKPGAFRQFSAALRDTDARARAARNIAASAHDPALARALENSSMMLLQTFSQGGFPAISALLQRAVPAKEQAEAAGFYADLLQRVLGMLYSDAIHAAPDDPALPQRLRDSMEAYSDAIEAQIFLLPQLDVARQVNASTLQVTHAPGAFLVYLGSALLALGVCAMYFIGERRLWVWCSPVRGSFDIAFSANRHSPALQAEFDAHRAALLDVIHFSR